MSLMLIAFLVLLGGSAASALLARWPRVSLAASCIAIIAAGIMAIIAAGSVLGGGASAMPIHWPTPLGNVALAMDGLSAWFVLMVGGLSVAVAIYSWGYMQHHAGKRPVGVFSAMVCLLVLAVQLTICAADVVVFLFGWELMSISAIVLISFNDQDPEVRKAAWTYLIATHIGTALCVYPLLAILVARSGGIAFSGFAEAAAAAPAALFLLGLFGFGTKAGFMPMHVWLPIAYPAAPSPVSALMSGAATKCGIYGLLRLISWLPPLPMWCAVLLLVIAAISGIMGILYALSQRQLKRMLAYSSVENIGMIGIGIGVGLLGRTLNQPVVAMLGFSGAILHVLNHSMIKGLLFLSAGAVLHDTGAGDIERLGGLARKTPANAMLFLIAAAAICGLPPLNGFVSEWLIYNALFLQAAGSTVYASTAAVVGLAALALIGGLALAAFAKVFSAIFLGEQRDRSVTVGETPATMIWGMRLLAAGCVMIGLGAWLVPLLRGFLAAPVGIVMQTSAADVLVPLPGKAPVTVALFMVLIVGLAVLRRWLSGRPGYAQGVQVTWGCGFAHGTPRIQYTGSSFGWPLVLSFAQFLRPRRRVERPAGCFPAAGELQTHTPDAVMTRGYQPLFISLARAMQRLWPLQHGRVQLYLLYIVGALLAVFIVEAMWTPLPRRQSRPTPAHVNRDEHRMPASLRHVPGD